MREPLLVNVQPYAIHDGQGIRTTVFFKGCPLACAWCHNPESQRYGGEWMRYPDRCIGCGRCEEGCPTGARQYVGAACPAEALVEKLARDQRFYEVSGGGVTLSGGEVMTQDTAYLIDLCQGLRRRGIPIYIDTCGHAPWASFEALLPYAGAFLYDLKHMAPQAHRRYTGQGNALILENAERLAAAGADLRLRIPVVPGVNDAGEDMEAMIAFARDRLGSPPVHLLPYHRLGGDKAGRLEGASPRQAFREPGPAEMEALRERWRRAGFEQVEIGG